MRAIIIIVVAVVLGFFGYQYAVNGRGPVEAVSVLTGQAAKEQAAAEQRAAQEQAAAEAEARAAEEAAAAEQAAAEAEAAAQTAAEAAMQAAEDIREEAESAVNAAVSEITDAVEGAVETMTEGDVKATPEALLTIDGFDADKVIALIDNTDLSDAQKTTLTNAVNTARDNPILLQPVLEQLKQVFSE